MSKRKIAQKTTLTSLAALMAAAPIVATPAAHAAEIPFEVTSVTLASEPDVNGDGKLNSGEVANVQVAFRIPGPHQGAGAQCHIPAGTWPSHRTPQLYLWWY